MAFWNKSEIDKIKSKYGIGKGTWLLTYFHTHVTKSLSLMKSENDAALDFAKLLAEEIRTHHGQSFLDEYHAFFNANLKNSKLLTEICTPTKKSAARADGTISHGMGHIRLFRSFPLVNQCRKQSVGFRQSTLHAPAR